MRQRLRRPLRYGSSLKRGSLAATLNKMPGPSPVITRPHPSSLMAQSTTVNITWPPEENGNGTGSFVLQVHLDGQQQQTQNETSPPPSTSSAPIYLSPKKASHVQSAAGKMFIRFFYFFFFFCNSVLIKFFYFLSPKELDRDFFRPPSILLHTPVKAGGSGAGWATASTASSLPSTPNRLQGN